MRGEASLSGDWNLVAVITPLVTNISMYDVRCTMRFNTNPCVDPCEKAHGPVKYPKGASATRKPAADTEPSKPSNVNARKQKNTKNKDAQKPHKH